MAQLNTLFNPSIMIRITQRRQTQSGRVAKGMGEEEMEAEARKESLDLTCYKLVCPSLISPV